MYWDIYFAKTAKLPTPKEKADFLVTWINEVHRQCYAAGIRFRKVYAGKMGRKIEIVAYTTGANYFGQFTQKGITDMCRYAGEAIGLPKNRVWGSEFSDRVVFKQFCCGLVTTNYVFIRSHKYTAGRIPGDDKTLTVKQ